MPCILAARILDAYSKDEDLERASYKTARLTFSGKTPVKLPWGGLAENQAYSVLAFVDGLEADQPGRRADYDLLSEASHPNFLQNFYFVIAGRVYDNYSNETFTSHAYQVLDRAIAMLEVFAHGIVDDAEQTFLRPVKTFATSVSRPHKRYWRQAAFHRGWSFSPHRGQ